MLTSKFTLTYLSLDLIKQKVYYLLMDIFFALSIPTRRNIIEILANKGQLSVADISKRFSITPAAISQHLKVLKEAKIVLMKKKAQQRLYKINPNSMIELETWAKKMRGNWEVRFSALDKLLETEKQKLKH